MTVLAERYELGAELGEGGMGRVVEAHDRVLGRDVAIKLLAPSAEQLTRERFLREARSAARLHHPNTVAVYDTGEADGQPYLVMELVRGRTLKDLLDDEGPLGVEDAVGITVGVLDGLAAAHRAGMIHRDVKPGNVLLPDEGGVKLSDFGIAKALDGAEAELTATGSLMGTPTYLAPELVGGESPSAASDVYSVGCLLYAQLTGQPPFTRGESLAIAYAHRNEPVPPITDARPDLPADLVAVVDRALAKDPAERYDSATAMRTALLDGPQAVPHTGEATQVVGAGVPARDRTQVLDGNEDEDTRVIGAPAAAAPAATPAVEPAAGRGRGRRWWLPLLVAALVVVAALILWSLWTDAPDDGEGLEPEEETEEVEEPEEDDPPPADEEPADDPPDEPEEEPEDETVDPPEEVIPEEDEDIPPGQDPDFEPPGQQEDPEEGNAAEDPAEEEPAEDGAAAEDEPISDGDGTEAAAVEDDATV